MCGITCSEWTSDSTSCAIPTWMWILSSPWTWSKTTRTSTITLSNPMKSELLWVMKAAGCRQINLAWLSCVTSCTHGSTCWCCHIALLLFPRGWAEQGSLCRQKFCITVSDCLASQYCVEKKVLPNLFQWSSCQFESCWLRFLIALWIRLVSPCCPSTLSCFEQ